MTIRKTWRAKLLLLVISVVVGLAIVELGLRVAGFSRPYFYTYDEDLGWMLRPGTSGWFRKEGEAYIHVNSSGMRDDREYVAAKPKDTFRVAVLGDSFAEALQVPVTHTFWSVLGQELNNCQPLKGQRVEVMNFGVSSYGTAQELIMLRDRVWAFSPDVVLLAFTPANDVRNNSRALERDELRPYFVLKNDVPVADMSFRDSASFRRKRTFISSTMYSLINYSRLLQLINGVRDDIVTRRAAQSQIGSQAGSDAGNQVQKPSQDTATAKATEMGIDDKAYTEPTDPAWREAWRVTEALLSQMNKEVTNHGAKFLVVVLTSGPQVTPDLQQREAFMSRLQTNDLFYPEHRIQTIADREHFAVLSLGPVFAKYAAEHQIALHGFGSFLNLGHWNGAGHRLAGETISERLCQQLMNRS
ncbi:MAG: SGNH/GDSL hydrolase family protein [Acidobacteriota bacterium]|nr:SGNH/GDSL hydrolase family protein [Acidobacteriota bacterium]